MATRKEEYYSYLQTTKWIMLSEQAKERDGHRCRLCFSNKSLVVHHRNYPKVFGEEPIEWLTTLCTKCHKMYHGIGKENDLVHKEQVGNKAKAHKRFMTKRQRKRLKRMRKEQNKAKELNSLIESQKREMKRLYDVYHKNLS